MIRELALMLVLLVGLANCLPWDREKLLQANSMAKAKSHCASYELRSLNYPAYTVALTGNKAFIKQEVKKWNIIPGICGVVGTETFQSVSDPDDFLRHRGYLIYLDHFADSSLYRKDACFYPRVNKFFPGTVAYESVNYPGHFIRHQGYRIKISRFVNTDLFKKDSSFHVG